jgi:hypothetical protein
MKVRRVTQDLRVRVWYELSLPYTQRLFYQETSVSVVYIMADGNMSSWDDSDLE